jgi:DNA modification methylase
MTEASKAGVAPWPPAGVKPYYCDGAVCIILGDCREIVPGLGRFDIVISDPPYGINHAHHSKTERTLVRPIIGDEDVSLGLWLCDWWKDRPLCVFASPKKPWPGKWRNLLVWDKGPAVGGGGDSSTCWKQTWELIQIRETGKINGNRDSAVLSYWMTPQDSADHPSAKPLPLMTYLMGKLTQPGETILDPFAGSCTTGRAAKDLGRRCVCIEREERYAEIGARRMQQEVLNLTEAQ